MVGSASISGLASGLDTATIVAQLMQLEAIPQSRLKTQVSTHESAVTKLQDLNTKLAALFTKAETLTKASGWSPVAAKSSYDKVTLTTATGAAPTSLSFTVLSTAKAHVLSSTDRNALTDVVLSGTDDLTLTIGDTQHTINTGGGTLQEVVDAVNNAGLGVRASALKVADGSYGLHVEATSAGSAGSFTLTRGNGTALMGGMTIATAGTNASIKVGNHTLTSATNTFADVLPGISITLAADAAPNTAVTATLATDKAAMTGTVKGLVEALNGVLADIDAAGKTGDGSVKKGPLAGDPGLRRLRDELVSTLYSAAGTGLSGFGVQLDRYGKLTFDTATFEAAYAKDPAAVEAAFAKSTTNTGFADRLAVITKRASDSTDGSVTMAIKGRKSTIDQINDNIERWDARLEIRRTTLTRQFTALETALGQMNSQSSWLAGQIATLPTSSSL